MCEVCARRWEADVEEARSQLRNNLAALDAALDALNDAEMLCAALAAALEKIEPDFVDSLLDDEARALWDAVKPYGEADDGDT